MGDECQGLPVSWEQAGGDLERPPGLLEFRSGLPGRQRHRSLNVKMLQGNRPKPGNTQFLPAPFAFAHWHS